MTQDVNYKNIPLARQDDLVVRELEDEVLKSDKAHCLNKAAALVLKHSDGETSVPALASIMSRELSVAVDEELVWIALDELQKNNLLQNRVRRPGRRPGLSRREAMKWALASAAALPLVTSIAAPAAAQTVSCVLDAEGCRPNGNNDAGLCTVSSQCCSCCCHTNTGLPADAHCTNGGGSVGCIAG
jgi:hypothetical protein